MKKLIALFLFLMIALPAFSKSDWRGKVVDENGDPVAYANVAVLSKADSTVVCGVTMLLSSLRMLLASGLSQVQVFQSALND